MNPDGGTIRIKSIVRRPNLRREQYKYRRNPTKYCATTRHHPRYGEELEMYLCTVARADTTSFWIASYVVNVVFNSSIRSMQRDEPRTCICTCSSTGDDNDDHPSIKSNLVLSHTHSFNINASPSTHASLFLHDKHHSRSEVSSCHS